MPDLSAETNYELVTLEDGRFGVRISEANRLPRTIDGFDSEEEAEAWIFQQVEMPTGRDGLPRHL